jgi:hypothetical protein
MEPPIFRGARISAHSRTSDSDVAMVPGWPTRAREVISEDDAYREAAAVLSVIEPFCFRHWGPEDSRPRVSARLETLFER